MFKIINMIEKFKNENDENDEKTKNAEHDDKL